MLAGDRWLYAEREPNGPIKTRDREHMVRRLSFVCFQGHGNLVARKAELAGRQAMQKAHGTDRPQGKAQEGQDAELGPPESRLSGHCSRTGRELVVEARGYAVNSRRLEHVSKRSGVRNGARAASFLATFV
jgi:hypothetical protein